MIKIFNQDCMEFLAKTPDKAYELAIVERLNNYDMAVDISKYVGYITLTQNKEMCHAEK